MLKRPPGIEKTEIVQTRVSKKLRAQVDAAATAEGMTTSEWLRDLIRAALRKGRTS